MCKRKVEKAVVEVQNAEKIKFEAAEKVNGVGGELIKGEAKSMSRLEEHKWSRFSSLIL
jgi:hypothetical protein